MKAIVLLHGLGTNKLIMMKMGHYLSQFYKIYYFEYKSKKYEKQKVLNEFHDFIQTIKESEVILIGHSMGGLVSRLYLSHHFSAKMKAIITVVSPNLGSYTAKYLHRTFLKELLLGSSGDAGLVDDIEQIVNKSRIPLH